MPRRAAKAVRGALPLAAAAGRSCRRARLRLHARPAHGRGAHRPAVVLSKLALRQRAAFSPNAHARDELVRCALAQAQPACATEGSAAAQRAASLRWVPGLTHCQPSRVPYTPLTPLRRLRDAVSRSRRRCACAVRRCRSTRGAEARLQTLAGLRKAACLRSTSAGSRAPRALRRGAALLGQP